MDASQLSDADTITEEKNGIEDEIDLEGERKMVIELRDMIRT
jgi:hypothetical protein